MCRKPYYTSWPLDEPVLEAETQAEVIPSNTLTDNLASSPYSIHLTRYSRWYQPPAGKELHQQKQAHQFILNLTFEIQINDIYKDENGKIRIFTI